VLNRCEHATIAEHGYGMASFQRRNSPKHLPPTNSASASPLLPIPSPIAQSSCSPASRSPLACTPSTCITPTPGCSNTTTWHNPCPPQRLLQLDRFAALAEHL
jgi:hypothetical protein